VNGNLQPLAERINGERLCVLGWSRAILLQLAHPLVAEAVHSHSTFRDTPLAWVRRFRHTLRTMLALTFGPPRERQAAVATIRAIHDRVNGTLPEQRGPFAAGTVYSAHDPDLLLWVHATLLDSIPLAYEHFIGPLTWAEKDAYCAAASDGLVDLGVPAARAPRTAAGLQTYLEGIRAARVLAVTDVSRALAHNVLSPPLGWAAGPVAYLQREFAIGTLPVPVREMYGFGWSTRRSSRLERWNARVRRVRAYTPARLARWNLSHP
jgi:uncharacterized protein (DUF2236 family)